MSDTAEIGGKLIDAVSKRPFDQTLMLVFVALVAAAGWYQVAHIEPQRAEQIKTLNEANNSTQKAISEANNATLKEAREHFGELVEKQEASHERVVEMIMGRTKAASATNKVQ